MTSHTNWDGRSRASPYEIPCAGSFLMLRQARVSNVQYTRKSSLKYADWLIKNLRTHSNFGWWWSRSSLVIKSLKISTSRGFEHCSCVDGKQPSERIMKDMTPLHDEDQPVQISSWPARTYFFQPYTTRYQACILYHLGIRQMATENSSCIDDSPIETSMYGAHSIPTFHCQKPINTLASGKWKANHQIDSYPIEPISWIITYSYVIGDIYLWLSKFRLFGIFLGVAISYQSNIWTYFLGKQFHFMSW